MRERENTGWKDELGSLQSQGKGSRDMTEEKKGCGEKEGGTFADCHWSTISPLPQEGY